MITLAFLICVSNGSCISVTPEDVFADKASCELMARVILDVNRQRVLVGELPEHTAVWTCIEWGEPV